MKGHEAWLAKATSDLKSAKKLIKDDDDTLDTAAYHTQQCAEKALDDRFFISKEEVVESIKKATTILNFVKKKF